MTGKLLAYHLKKNSLRTRSFALPADPAVLRLVGWRSLMTTNA